MVIMEDVFEKLRNLQDILSRKIVLERDIQDIPKALTTQEEMLVRLKKTFIEKDMECDKAKAQAVELRELLAAAEKNREGSEKNMDSVTTQREYEALDKEIRDAAGKEAQYRKDLQREERHLAEIVEQLEQNKSLIDQQEKELAEQRVGVEVEIAEKSKLIAKMEEEETELRKYLDPEIFFKFERIIRNKMGKGIVAIKGGVCTGCHMILPVQFANDVRLGEDIVFCPYCSRILFHEESEVSEESYFNIEDSGSLSDLDDMDEDDFDDGDEEDEKVSIEYEE
jgi:predicted  nucleic acid-binding Zn-ribbon protein